MTPEKCPNCGTKLEPHLLACPNCPMSFPEGDPVAEIHPFKQSRYYQFLMPALFFGGLGWGIWAIANGLYNLADQSSRLETTPAMRALGLSGDSGRDKTAPTPPWMATATAVLAPAPKAREADDDEQSVVISAAAPARKPARRWRLRGAIYDLVDLRPLAGCAVIFIDPEADHRIMTQTDSSGRYRAVVPPLGERGYVVEVRKGGYSPAYLDPGTEGVRALSASRRQELANSLSTVLSATSATVQAYDEKPLVTDFYLARRR